MSSRCNLNCPPGSHALARCLIVSGTPSAESVTAADSAGPGSGTPGFSSAPAARSTPFCTAPVTANTAQTMLTHTARIAAPMTHLNRGRFTLMSPVSCARGERRCAAEDPPSTLGVIRLVLGHGAAEALAVHPGTVEAAGAPLPLGEHVAGGPDP